MRKTSDVGFFLIDDIIGEARNRVVKMGLELEGAWERLPPGTAIERDTSVFKDKTTQTQVMPKGCNYVGELPIGPIQPVAFPRYLKKYYPHKVNETCGMHVHMSFMNVRHYNWLMVPEYQETICEYLTRWARKEKFPETHHIWSRLAGKHIYCQKKFWPDSQILSTKKDFDQNRTGHRYTIVNYCKRYMTIEIRVLPMMETVEQAQRAVKMVLDITNACLVKAGAKEEKIQGKVTLPDGGVYEEIVEEVI